MAEKLLVVKRGDFIRADEWNRLVRRVRANSVQEGPGIVVGPNGSYRRGIARPSASVQVSTTWAKITGSSGTTPPYLYSATEQQGSSPGVFVNKNLPITWAGTLRNLAEIGAGGTGAAPLPDNSIVIVHQAEDGTWYFDRLHYRGVYG